MTPSDLATMYLNLAQPRLGAGAIACSDDFFAPMERMISPESPVYIPDKYDDHGKWMDGWESRRKREPGHDWCIVRLGLPGRLVGVNIDTSHFTGNYAPAASLEGWHGAGDPGDSAEWTEILPRVELAGDSHHWLEITHPEPVSHVRLNIYPDGGVARLRVFGIVQRDWSSTSDTERLDLVSGRNGGRALLWNDAHFGTPWNMLMPGRGENMGDGWETRRRREPGNDWSVLSLGHPGRIDEITVDTAHFKGNYPDRCSIQATLIEGEATKEALEKSTNWPVLMPETKLSADAIHTFTEEIQDIGPISHVRLNIFPDGGISRLRLMGTIARDAG